MKYKKLTFGILASMSFASFAALPTSGSPNQILTDNGKQYIYKTEYKRWFLTKLQSADDNAWALKNDKTYQYDAAEGAWIAKTPYSNNTVLFTDGGGKVEMKTIAEAKSALGINAVDAKIDETKEAFATSIISVKNGGTGLEEVDLDNFLVGTGSTELQRLTPAQTKDKIGLGNVDNYGTAVTADAVAGVADDKFMTPKSTKDAILALSPPDELATTAEAEAGVEATKQMTPKTTAEAIKKLAPKEFHMMTTAARVTFTDTATTGTPVYDTDEDRLYVKHSNGYWVEK